MPRAEAKDEPPAAELRHAVRRLRHQRGRPREDGDDAGGEPDPLGVGRHVGQLADRVLPAALGEPEAGVALGLGGLCYLDDEGGVEAEGEGESGAGHGAVLSVVLTVPTRR